MTVKDMLLGRHIFRRKWAGAESNHSGKNHHLPLVTVIFKLTDDSVEYLNCQFSDVRTADRFLQSRFDACKEAVIQIIRFKQLISQDGYRILNFIICVCHNNHLLSGKEVRPTGERLVKTCRPHVTGEDLHLTCKDSCLNILLCTQHSEDSATYFATVTLSLTESMAVCSDQ